MMMMIYIISLFFQEACVNKIVKFMGGEVRNILFPSKNSRIYPTNQTYIINDDS